MASFEKPALLRRSEMPLLPEKFAVTWAPPGRSLHRPSTRTTKDGASPARTAVAGTRTAARPRTRTARNVRTRGRAAIAEVVAGIGPVAGGAGCWRPGERARRHAWGVNDTAGIGKGPRTPVRGSAEARAKAPAEAPDMKR